MRETPPRDFQAKSITATRQSTTSSSTKSVSKKSEDDGWSEAGGGGWDDDDGGGGGWGDDKWNDAGKLNVSFHMTFSKAVTSGNLFNDLLKIRCPMHADLSFKLQPEHKLFPIHFHHLARGICISETYCSRYLTCIIN